MKRVQLATDYMASKVRSISKTNKNLLNGGLDCAGMCVHRIGVGDD